MTPIDFIKIKYPGEFKETSATNLFNLKEVENLMKDYAKQILEEYTNRIVKSSRWIAVSDFAADNLSKKDCTIDKESITNQLPLMLKELGYEQK